MCPKQCSHDRLSASLCSSSRGGVGGWGRVTKSALPFAAPHQRECLFKKACARALKEAVGRTCAALSLSARWSNATYPPFISVRSFLICFVEP